MISAASAATSAAAAPDDTTRRLLGANRMVLTPRNLGSSTNTPLKPSRHLEGACPRCPQRDSNPCYGLERAATWTASRWGRRDSGYPSLEGEAVDANFVRPKPVAKAPVGDADRPERLPAGIDGRWERLLLVLEHDLSAGNRPTVAPRR